MASSAPTRLLLSLLTRRRPYANRPWQRWLATSRQSLNDKGLLPQVAVVTACTTWVVHTFAWSGGSFKAQVLGLVMVGLWMGLLGWLLRLSLGHWSGALLSRQEFWALSVWMNESAELTQLCLPWWPQDEPLRRRDWYRVMWLRKLAVSAPVPSAPEPAWDEWVKEGQAALASLATQVEPLRGTPAPAAESPEIQGLVERWSKIKHRPSLWDHAGLRQLQRFRQSAPQYLEPLLHLALTPLLSLMLAWLTGHLPLVVLVGAVALFLSLFICLEAPALPGLPPSEGIVKGLEYVCNTEPLLAWLWAHRTPIAVSASEVNQFIEWGTELKKVRAREEEQTLHPFHDPVGRPTGEITSDPCPSKMGRLRPLILRNLAHRRPYANRAWHRALGLSGTVSGSDRRLWYAICMLGSSTWLVHAFAWNGGPVWTSALVGTWLWLVGREAHHLMRYYSGGILDKELAQMSKWMEESPALSEFCAQWWPRGEPLRRRDWYRVKWTRWMLTPPVSAAPAWDAWVEESRQHLDGLNQMVASWRDVPPPVSSVASEHMKKIQRMVKRRPRVMLWNHAWMRHLQRIRQFLDTDDRASEALTYLMLPLLAATVAWVTDHLALSTYLVALSLYLGTLAFIEGWRWSRLQPPAPQKVKELVDLCSSQPISAWMWAQHCREGVPVVGSMVIQHLAWGRRLLRQANHQGALANDAAFLNSLPVVQESRTYQQRSYLHKELAPVVAAPSRRARL